MGPICRVLLSAKNASIIKKKRHSGRVQGVAGDQDLGFPVDDPASSGEVALVMAATFSHTATAAGRAHLKVVGILAVASMVAPRP